LLILRDTRHSIATANDVHDSERERHPSHLTTPPQSARWPWVQREARRFLSSSGIEDCGHCFDGYGEYLPFDVIKLWPEEERTEFFEAINDFSVSKFGARLLCHPNSKQKSQLPKRPKSDPRRA
jgi:hypothetical protein